MIVGISQKELNEEYKQQVLQELTYDYAVRKEYNENEKTYYNYDNDNRLVSKYKLIDSSDCFEYISTKYKPTEYYIPRDVTTRDILVKVKNLFKNS